MTNVFLRASYGAALSRIIRDLNLDISRTALAKLYDYELLRKYDYGDLAESDKDIAMANNIESSLFPDWLDESKSEVQENPDEWYYVGHFPYGKWVNDEND